MKLRAMPLDPPPREAWDFDLGSCPAEELKHCCFYEYALEQPSVRQWVAFWRRERRRFMHPENEVMRGIHDRPDLHMLVDLLDFPQKHWLELSPEVRAKAVKTTVAPRVSLRSVRGIGSAHGGQRSRYYEISPYAGPQSADLAWLKDAREAWRSIEEAKQEFRFLLEDGTKPHLLWEAVLLGRPTQWQPYLSKERTAKLRRLAGLDGKEFVRKFEEVLAEIEKAIERRYRPPAELVVFDIDWTRRPEELVREFRRWLTTSRVHCPRPRGGGHPTKAVELLKALGAKRLLDFFRTSQNQLPQPYRAQTLHAALCDYTRACRSQAQRPAKPLYSKPSGWNDAEQSAAAFLKTLDRSRTVGAAPSFLAALKSFSRNSSTS
jgi:hypothetical protein